MLIATTCAVALRCPVCGKIQYGDLSLFAVAASKSLQFSCECGEPILSISTRDGKSYTLQLECLMCEGRHLWHYSRREIWSNRLLRLVCEDTGLEVGFIGPLGQIKKSVRQQERSLSQLAEDIGLADYFENPQVVYEILECLQQLAGSGKLTCTCGNRQIEVNLFPERVELRCSSCGAVAVLSTGSGEDLERIIDKGEIRLESGRPGKGDLSKDKRHRRHSKK